MQEELDYQSIRTKLLSGEISCVGLAERYLQRIHEKKELNAFITLFDDEIFENAKRVDDKIVKGDAGKLAGMIIAVKDILMIKGKCTTCGSKILENFYAPYHATVIERLEDEDAIFIGKTNMDEFGMGSSNENSAFGPVKNPHDLNRIPGGSSGGSAVAVAANLATTALGTDTGGSIRQPASLTGIIGLRPTYGRVSRYGLIAFASSLDQIGCFGRCVTDCSDVLQIIAGHDERDATSSDEPVPNYNSFLTIKPKGLQIGLPDEYMGKGLDSEIKEHIEMALRTLEKGGANIKRISLPHTEYGIAAYYLLCTAEASSNLARYDGVRFGLRVSDTDLHSMMIKTRSQGFGDEVKRRIMLGTYILSAGYYDAYYKKAQKVRTLIRKDFENAFQSCDIIIGPSSPITAFKLGERLNDPLQMYLSDIYTVTAPMAGLPVISIPIGKDRHGLPIGMQITGKPFREGDILGVSHWFEKHSPFKPDN